MVTEVSENALKNTVYTKEYRHVHAIILIKKFKKKNFGR